MARAKRRGQSRARDRGGLQHVGWFPLSALGRTPDPADKTPFTPRGALAPLLWILARRGVHPSAQAQQVTHTAQRLTATAADLPAPTAAVRARNAGIVTAFGAAALIAGLIALVTLSKGPSTPPTLIGTENAAASGPAGSGASGSQGSGAQAGQGGHGANSAQAGGGGGVNSTKQAHPSGTPGPSSTIRRHFEDLDNGDYEAAFGLMSRSYRAENPNWVGSRSTADPMIDIVDVGTTVYGGGHARVYVKLYARDRNPSEGSDTQCRRFEGIAELVAEDGAWRYERKGNGFSAIVEPSGDPNCHP